MQPYPVHRPVHYEGSSRHITTVLQNGNGDKEEEDIRHKGKYGTDPANDAIAQEGTPPG